jgi:hypothetical protein
MAATSMQALSSVKGKIEKSFLTILLNIAEVREKEEGFKGLIERRRICLDSLFLLLYKPRSLGRRRISLV